jgi:hypothetical protein
MDEKIKKVDNLKGYKKKERDNIQAVKCQGCGAPLTSSEVLNGCYICNKKNKV